MNVDTVSHPEKAARVRVMFDQIAPSYDLLNHLLSLNIDKLWRSYTVRQLGDVLARKNAYVLDLCCGTGDLSLALGTAAPHATVFGLDFSRPMLDRAQKKNAHSSSIALLQGDATSVPFTDRSFDAVTIAFGLRNLSSVELGVREIFRLLRPGGRAAILEFSRPVVPVFRGAFQFYFKNILPRIGGIVSGAFGAYSYLPASVQSFPDQKRLKAIMEDCGFANVRYRNLSAGIAAVHFGDRE